MAGSLKFFSFCFSVVVCLFLSFLSGPAYSADDFMEISEEGTASNPDVEEAKRDIFKSVIQKISVQQIKEIIGETKFDANKNIIQNRIINNSVRYIPFVKGEEPEIKGQDVKVKVLLKFSKESLKELLAKEGLLQTSEAPGVVLPLIAVTDRVKNGAYRWWLGGTYGDRDPLRLHAYQVVSRLRDLLGKEGLYVANPVSWPEHYFIPKALKKESYALEDLPMLGSLFKSQVVIRGVMTFEPKVEERNSAQLTLRLTAVAVSTGRPLAEISPTTTVELNASQNSNSDKVKQLLDLSLKEFADQLADTWNRGVGRARPLRLALRGVTTYQDLEGVKNLFQKNLKGLRSLRERKFEMAGVWVELEGISSGSELGQMLKAPVFESHGVKVADVKDAEVVVDVKFKN